MIKPTPFTEEQKCKHSAIAISIGITLAIILRAIGATFDASLLKAQEVDKCG